MGGGIGGMCVCLWGGGMCGCGCGCGCVMSVRLLPYSVQFQHFEDWHLSACSVVVF